MTTVKSTSTCFHILRKRKFAASVFLIFWVFILCVPFTFESTFLRFVRGLIVGYMWKNKFLCKKL